MTGLVYKELRQNRYLLLGMLILPALIAFPMCAFFLNAVGSDDGQGAGTMQLMDMIREQQNVSIWIVFLVLAYMVSAVLQGMIFRGDDRKVFAMWTASSPDGAEGYIRVKYELTFVMIMLTLGSVQIGDWIMTIICGAHDAEWFGLSQPIILLSYVQIMIQAADIPFSIRFGVKNGSMIKSIVLVILAIVLLIVFGAFAEQLIDAVIYGNTAVLGTAARLMFALCPVISLALYVLSYRLSCRLYLKGAAQYDK